MSIYLWHEFIADDDELYETEEDCPIEDEEDCLDDFEEWD